MKKSKKTTQVQIEDKNTRQSLEDNREIVLIAVTGMSPAVLTETVWALAHPQNGSEPVIPHRVIVISTTIGRREITEALFTPHPRFGGKTVWETLRGELEKEGLKVKDRLRFGTTGDDIRVFTRPDPQTNRTLELDDIRTPEDNSAAADFILENLRALVEDPEKIVIGSVAGGRKTMSALLYACFSLIGRDCDRLTHVLVNEPYDQLREFFFPTQPGGLITHRDGGKFDPANAKIDLADIPFVHLRYAFLKELGRPPGSFMRLVDYYNENVRNQIGENIRLTINRANREFEVNGQRIQTSAKEHCVLLFLAHRVKDGEPPFGKYLEALEPLNEFRSNLIAQADPVNFSDWRSSNSLKQKFDEEDLRKVVSGLRTKLRESGGDAALFAQLLPERGKFGLNMKGSLIFIK